MCNFIATAEYASSYLYYINLDKIGVLRYNLVIN